MYDHQKYKSRQIELINAFSPFRVIGRKNAKQPTAFLVPTLCQYWLVCFIAIRRCHSHSICLLIVNVTSALSLRPRINAFVCRQWWGNQRRLDTHSRLHDHRWPSYHLFLNHLMTPTVTSSPSSQRNDTPAVSASVHSSKTTPQNNKKEEPTGKQRWWLWAAHFRHLSDLFFHSLSKWAVKASTTNAHSYY